MGNAYRSVLALKPTGDAVPANVLAGKTFSNAEGTGKTGTMVNNGAVSVTLTDQDPTYTIPEGYHNGSGVVGFSASGGDGADLIVTCSSVFAGATISCTDGTTTYQKTCPSSSPFEVVFDSIPVGTWTISGSYSGETFTTIFTVLDFEAVLNAIPEGSTVTPTDDIQTWLNCANIWDKTYTTISQILSDASTLQALIASSNAVNYMARSTTWASDVTANQSAMSYIGLDDYCADTLLTDSTWLNAICNSTYFESVLNVKIPTMTSNTTPSGKVSSNVSAFSDPYIAVDGNDTTYWQTYTNVRANDYWQYEFPNNVQICKASFLQYGSGTRACTLILKGSSDGNNFDTIGSLNIPSTANLMSMFNFLNFNKYKIFRLCASANGDGNFFGSQTINWLFLSLQLYGRA